MKNLVFAIVLVVALNGCDLSGTRSLIIDSSSFTNYPAVFVSLDRGEAVPVPETLRGSTIDADLWIEPGVPKITGVYAEFEGANHPGIDSKVAYVEEADFKKMKKVPDDVYWEQELPEKAAKTGFTFVVLSSSEQVYKVRINQLSANKVSLSFAKLK